jgi:hypothetical protein
MATHQKHGIRMQECGDGNDRADNAALLGGTASVDKTASYTMTPEDSGKGFTNRGAGGSITFTLPVPKYGMWFMFTVVASQALVVHANASEKVNGQAQISGSTAQTCVAFVFCADGSNWQVMVGSGTWTTS